MPHKLHKANYTLVDGARVDDALADLLAANRGHQCLYKGKSATSLAALAPYIFPFENGSSVSDDYLAKAWGASWGVLFSCSRPIADLVQHFRKFTVVQTEDYKELYFRFYDPRVLRLFLPTCTSEQLKEFFGFVRYFICEDEDPALALVFSLKKSGELVVEQMQTSLIFPDLPTEHSGTGD